MGVARIAALLCVCASATACSTRGVDVPCACPCECFAVRTDFACSPSVLPVVALSGPCEVGEPYAAQFGNVPTIAGTGTGVCHATLSLGDGGTFATDITFTAQWYACGSDPHGCGEDFEAVTDTWPIDNACADAGAADALPDMASGDADE